MFDRRWLFGLANPCSSFLLAVPILLGLASLAGILGERRTAGLEVDGLIVALLALYGLLALACLFLMLSSYLRGEQQAEGVGENQAAIRGFSHEL